MQNIVDRHPRETAYRVDGRAELWVEGHIQLSGKQMAMVLIEV